jgi:AraC family transcriptional regulator
MHKEETRSYYQQKLEDLLEFIQNNLNSDLNIKTLAAHSGISMFHFHRIISAYLGESLGSYINHLRLDTAARAIKNTDEPIGEIAVKIGYSDVQAFSKSFTRAYSISPSEYRTDKECILDNKIDFSYSHNEVEMHDQGSKIRNIPVRQVVYIEGRGRYGGDETLAAWNDLTSFIIKNRLIAWNSEAFSIYYDDPEIIGVGQCRFDICYTIRKKIELTGVIKYKVLDGGKYLIYRYKGPYDKLWEVYNKLYKEVISGLSGYKLSDRPVIEKYIKYSDKIKPENLVTEINIPIEPMDNSEIIKL